MFSPVSLTASITVVHWNTTFVITVSTRWEIISRCFEEKPKQMINGWIRAILQWSGFPESYIEQKQFYSQH